LNELYRRLQTSEANGQLLTNLCAELSRQNDDLKNYNSQIAERMQERDESLASAYGQIDKLEKRWLKAVIAITIMTAVILGFIVMSVKRL
jgi:cell division protein FtsL